MRDHLETAVITITFTLIRLALNICRAAAWGMVALVGVLASLWIGVEIRQGWGSPDGQLGGFIVQLVVVLFLLTLLKEGLRMFDRWVGHRLYKESNSIL